MYHIRVYDTIVDAPFHPNNLFPPKKNICQSIRFDYRVLPPKPVQNSSARANFQFAKSIAVSLSPMPAAAVTTTWSPRFASLRLYAPGVGAVHACSVWSLLASGDDEPSPAGLRSVRGELICARGSDGSISTSRMEVVRCA